MSADPRVVPLARQLVGAAPITAITREGEGWDHVAWRIETSSGEWIVRIAKDDDDPAESGRYVKREHAVMQLVSRFSSWVAEPFLLDADLGALGYRRVAGISLQHVAVAGPIDHQRCRQWGAEVGAFIATVAAIDIEGISDQLECDADLIGCRDEALDSLTDLEVVLSRQEIDAVARVLDRPTPSELDPDQLVLMHNDLGAEHIFVDADRGQITGIIDWTDTALADPAADLGRILRDLGDPMFDAAVDAFERGCRRGDRFNRTRISERAHWFARGEIIENVVYAVSHRPDLVPFELGNLRRLFAL